MRHLENLPKFSRALSKWRCSDIEKTRRMLDLVFVSALVDAGAGPNWKYMSDGKVITSSEGLGAASLDMFIDGLFSSDKAQPHRVNSLALKSLTEADMEKGFPICPENQIQSLPGRLGLLTKLGAALHAKPEFFGTECARPGHFLDYVFSNF